MDERGQTLPAPEGVDRGAELGYGRRSSLSTIVPVQSPHFAVSPLQGLGLSLSLRSARDRSGVLGQVREVGPDPVREGGVCRIQIGHLRCIGSHWSYPVGESATPRTNAWLSREI